MEKSFDVFGIGNPLVDIFAEADDELITQMGLNKGIMGLIDLEFREKILSAIKGKEKPIMPGGSCPNTIIALANFGAKPVLAGKTGTDEFGKIFLEKIQAAGVTANIESTDEDKTGSSIILISPDGERTMNTYLGMCRRFSKEDLNEELLLQSKRLYFTGYMWDTDAQKEATLRALELAKQNGIQVIFDVADPFAVDRNKEVFPQLIKDYANIVFANNEEANMMFGTEDPLEAAKELSKITDIAVVKMGSKGSVIVTGSEQIDIPIYKVEVKDTTGAGDMYAAGFIYGIINEYPLEKCGKIASYSAAQVVKQIGARLEYSIKDEIETLT